MGRTATDLNVSGKNDLRDRVDDVLDRWVDEFPERDTQAMGVLLRVARVNRDITRSLSASVSAAVPAVDSGSTFAVLLLLRISGSPYEQSPSWLADMMQIYPNHLSNLLDRMAAHRLISRQRDETDRRRITVRLSAEGIDAIDRAFDAHYAAERQLTASLTPDELEQLAALLRKMTLDFEGPIGSGRREPRPTPAAAE
jgi:DNA-binding MarR family transcriptional regulator